MRLEEIKICVLRVGGTNCDMETQRSLQSFKVQTEILHVNEIVKHRNLLEFDALVIPGGFSYGDYVRAGVIWAKWLVAKLGKDLKRFVDEKRPMFGICNGFQVFVEAGLIPGFEGISVYPEAALTTNVPPGYHCRWIYVKHENNGNCLFTRKVHKGGTLRMPVAHSEGRFIFSKEREKKILQRLYENDQVVFRYCNERGEGAEGRYPVNPNGAFHDIAGICNPEGTIFGLMPHPERAFYWWQQPDWTSQNRLLPYGDGKIIFESLIEYLVKNA